MMLITVVIMGGHESSHKIVNQGVQMETKEEMKERLKKARETHAKKVALFPHSR